MSCQFSANPVGRSGYGNFFSTELNASFLPLHHPQQLAAQGNFCPNPDLNVGSSSKQIVTDPTLFALSERDGLMRSDAFWYG